MAAWDQVPLQAPGTLFGAQPDYAKTMFDIISAPGTTLRANQENDRDYAAKMQALADTRKYNEGRLAVDQGELAAKIARPDLYGTTQYYDKDAQGNLYPYIISKTGEKKYIGAEPGRSVAVKTVPVDTGTGTQFVNPLVPGGTPAATIPRDVAGAAAAKTIGEGAGAAAVSLPTVEAAAQRMYGDIDAALNDPAIGQVTGPFDVLTPTFFPGSRRAQSRINKIKGEAFLAAYNDLRGAGAITEQEGAAATAAYHRLEDQGLNDADYAQALQEFRAEVGKLVEVARRKAAGANAPPAPDAPPPPAPDAAPGGAPPPPPPGFTIDQ